MNCDKCGSYIDIEEYLFDNLCPNCDEIIRGIKNYIAFDCDDFTEQKYFSNYFHEDCFDEITCGMFV